MMAITKEPIDKQNIYFKISNIFFFYFFVFLVIVFFFTGTDGEGFGGVGNGSDVLFVGITSLLSILLCILSRRTTRVSIISRKARTSEYNYIYVHRKIIFKKNI